MAAAYAQTYGLKNFEFTSSGLMTWENDPRPIDFVSPWAIKIAKQDGIDGMLWGKKRHKTTNAMLAKQDLIIFANENVYKRALQRLDFDRRKAIVWNIRDVQDWEKKWKLGAVQKRARTRRYIKMRIRELVKIMTETSWVDIVSEDNQPLGYRLPTRLAKRRGLYSRGCHAIITTPNGNILIQKRSRNIMFAPGMIDITMGGHVDDGETPRAAMKREIVEETGLKVKMRDMKFLEIYRQHSYHPKYKMWNRVFNYTYHVQLDTDKPELVWDENEVEWVKVMSPKKAKQLVKYGSLPKVGRVVTKTREYYRRIVGLVAK